MKLRAYGGRLGAELGKGYRDLTGAVQGHALGSTALLEVEFDDGRTVQLRVEEGLPYPHEPRETPRDGAVFLRCYGNIPARVGNGTQHHFHEVLLPEPATHDDNFNPLPAEQVEAARLAATVAIEAEVRPCSSAHCTAERIKVRKMRGGRDNRDALECDVYWIAANHEPPPKCGACGAEIPGWNTGHTYHCPAGGYATCFPKGVG